MLMELVLTLLPLLVLEHLHGHERGTAGEQLVAELSLVVLLVGLVVAVFGVVEAEHDCWCLCGLEKGSIEDVWSVVSEWFREMESS
jgi:hypothetical protein